MAPTIEECLSFVSIFQAGFSVNSPVTIQVEHGKLVLTTQ